MNINDLEIKKWTHKILPADAQAELKRAAQTPVTDEDPLARSRAIDQALRRIRGKYPNLFKFQPRGTTDEN